MIKTKNLSFEYRHISDDAEQKGILALEDINLDIEKGDFVAILGHNGSGKSTFAKLINALLLPTSGDVFVLDMNTRDEDLLWNIRQNAGMVFQNPDNQIIATLVEEDIAFGPENLGIPPEEIRKRVDRSLKDVGMEKYAKRTPSRLSGGQKQRVAIGGILAMEPNCIILDEPTAMLDPVGRQEVLDSVIKLNKEKGITVLFITHFMEEAVKANRVVVMDDGKVAMDGTPKEIFSKVDELHKIGLDVPQVTKLAKSLREKGLNVREDIITIEEMVENLCQLKSEI